MLNKRNFENIRYFEYFPDENKDKYPILIYLHGAGDDCVPCINTIEMISKTKKHSSKSVKVTIYPDCSHDAWTETYRNQEVYNWLLSCVKK